VIRRFLILSILVNLTACSDSQQEGTRELWEVIMVSSEDFPVKEGMNMAMTEDLISFSDTKQTVCYSILKNNNRLVLKTDTARILFRIEEISDSILIFRELYSLHPLTLSFIKTPHH